MKRITVLFCFLLSIFFTYGQEVTIGTGTASMRQPLSSYHGYSRSVALYTSAEINQVGFINKLAWDIGVIKGARPVKIYLKEVESTALVAGNWDTFIQGASVVYDEEFTPTNVGFNNINLVTSFNYTGGTKNLLVLVETNFGGGGNGDGTAGLEIKSTTATNMHFEIGRDTTVPTANLSATTGRPNIKLTFGTEITCAPISAQITNVAATSVSFNVTERNSTTGVSYEIRTEGAAGSGATGLVTSGTVTDLATLPITVSGLTGSTNYSLYVRANCAADDTSVFSVAATFRTKQIAATLPYNDDFEGHDNWDKQSNTVNKWVVGTAVNNGGTKSLYLSKDNGATNTYDTGVSTVAHAYRDISIPAGTNEIAVNFDWRCVGEGTTTRFDYFRVWAVPVSFDPVSGTQIAAATDRIRLGQSEYNGNDQFRREQLVGNATSFAGQTMRLVFEWRQDGSGGTQPPAAIDNVSVSVITCSAPTALQLNAVSTSSATIAWTAATGQTQYEVYHTTETTIPGATVTGSVVTATNPYTIQGLTPSTNYFVWVRTVCSETDKSSWVQLPIRTKQIAAALPYNDDFEGHDNWDKQSNTVNKWVVGTAVNNGGTKSLYISKDNGATNTYDTGVSTVAHAYRDLVIPAGTNEIAVNFDWRCVGEGGTWDYFRVWAVSVSFDPVSGTQIAAAADRIRLGQSEYNGNDQFRREQLVGNATAFAGQTMRLVFEWRQDGSGGTQPPAAIDNVSVSVITCSAPTNLEWTAATSTTATVGWTAVTGQTQYEVYHTTETTEPGATVTGSTVTTENPYTIQGLTPNTQYNVWVRTVCSATDKSFWKKVTIVTGQVPGELPYTDGFEGQDNWNKSSNALNKWVVGTAAQNGGTKSLYISKDNGATNTYDISVATVAHAYRDIVVPAGTTDISVAFDWRCVGEGTSSDYFRAWLVPTTFVPTVGTQITAETNRIKLGGEYNANAEFRRTQMIQNAAVFAGQTMRLVFEWRQDGSVGTQPPAAIDNVEVAVVTCYPPTNLAVSTVTDSSITVSWTAVTGQTQYEVYHSTTATSPGATVTGSVVTTDNPYTITGLTANTQYYVWVRTVCSATDKSFWVHVPITTGQIAAEMPYTEDFEGDNNWSMGTGTANKWVIGTAVHNGGTKSLYISKDNGATNEYERSGTMVTHAYRDIAVPAGTSESNFSFDWRCMGEGFTFSRLDYFRVWLVPNSFVPTTGQQITAGTNRRQIGAEFNNQETFASVDEILDLRAYAGSTLRLVFEWRQDGSGGTQPPAAIDNITLKRLSCPAVTDLQAEPIEGSIPASALLTWESHGDETQWEVFIVDLDDTTVPGDATAGIVVNQPRYVYPDPDPANPEDRFYKFYVRPICSDTDKGRWSKPGVISFIPPPGCAKVDADIEFSEIEGFEKNENGDYVICEKGAFNFTLGASYYDILKTNKYKVDPIEYRPPFPFKGGDAIELTTDDRWSDIIDLGFDFCFYGNSYDKILINTNGTISFSIKNVVPGGRYTPNGGAGDGAAYNAVSPIPSDPGRLVMSQGPNVNAIMGVFQDTDPARSPDSRSINYQIIGKAPCRTLVFNVYQLGMFSCGYNPDDIEGSTQTSQIVMYEGTNIIEVYVKNRNADCDSWNGNAIIGIQNADGTQGIAPPGRNTGRWTAQNEAWRFTPDGDSTAEFLWEKDGEFFSSETTIDISVTESVKYTAKATYEICGEITELTKEFNFVKEDFVMGTPVELVDCARELGEINFVDLSDNNAKILGELDPTKYTLQYFETEEDMNNNVNPLDNIHEFTERSKTIYAKLTNKNTGCSLVKTFRVVVQPPLDVTVAKDVSVCSIYTFPALKEGEAYYTQKNGLGTKYVEGDVLDVVGTHDIYIYRVDEKGCYGESHFSLEIVEQPIADRFENMVFTCEVYPLPALSEYNKYYTLPNGEGTELPVGTIIYEPTTIYIFATLEGKKGAVCVDQSSFTIDFEECPIPKGISPNGDGLNDSFDLSEHGVSKIQIFNRTGIEVYSQGLYQSEWKGQDKSGNKLPSGTYYYVIVSNGKMRTGWVQINY
ncbi:gliding motility-associated-like protein [Myroides gitamensis]|uniref:fibronectin type III domain-containing protein n=1 Tax=Myroides odoratus TaxID=256 RepID=UPI002169F50A|nr:fibronectin type III domain-containing protein [Myroides odoratus]MCS4240475.1 gliding motility-associated-like protein [Myroides odoratus]MDH6602230.1 gliding motility-associated-like protein [Myroides gitamensis]